MTAQLGCLFGVFVIAMLLRIPIFMSLMLSTVAYAVVFKQMPSVVLMKSLTQGLDKPLFSAIPSFLLLGLVMNAGGMTQRLLRLATALLGWCRGGLAHVNIGASILFGGISGSAVADVSAIGSLMIPTMQKAGYPGPFAAAVTAASASIGLLIPPSIPLVLFGLFNNVSVGQLFIAGLIPGVMMGAYLIAVSAWLARRRGYPAVPWQGIVELRRALKGSLVALLLPVLLIVCMSQGIATTSEIAAVAVVYAVLVSTVVHRDVTLFALWNSVVQSALDSARILCIIAASGGFIWIVANLGVSRGLATWLISLHLSPLELLSVIAVALLLIGTLVGPALQMILIIPPLTPLVLAAGIDILHFGVVCTLVSSLSLLTPPIGILLFLTASQACSPVRHVVREVIPFLLALVLLLITVVVIPSLSTGLVQVLGS